MTEQEHLLVVLIEECGEVIHAASKALRFGLKDTHPKRGDVPCDELVARELDDLMAVAAKLTQRGVIRAANVEAILTKSDKVDHFITYAKHHGAIV